jgi:hypothetical protein
MENSTEIGDLIQEIMRLGFRLEIFQRWKLDHLEGDFDSVESSRPSSTSSPKFHIAILSNELRDSPAMNSRYLKADTLVEALTKALRVAHFIVDKSKPVQ